MKKYISKLNTSFIKNINGINKLGRNKYFKNKKCFKLSTLTDINGIPISILINKGNIHDTIFGIKHTNKFPFKLVGKKKVLMADMGYDSSKLRNILKSKNIISIIPFNKRNTKNKDKIKYLTFDQLKLYKKRITIENSYCWIKKNKRIAENNEKLMSSYKSFLYFALTKILLKRI